MFGMDKLSPSKSLTCLGIPEGVQRYVERRSLFIAKKRLS